MSATKKLDTKGLEERKKIIAHFVANAGAEKTEAWLNDPQLLSIVNALAASFAKGN